MYLAKVWFIAVSFFQQDVREEVEAEENFEEFHQTNAIRRQVKKKGGRGGRKSVGKDL